MTHQENALKPLKRKYIILTAAVAAVIGAGYSASSWYFGQQIEAVLGQIDAEIAALPYLKLIRHDYERGVFGANETITIEIPAALIGMPRVPEPALESASPPLRVTLKSAIQHGPIPGFSAFALGSATTVIEFDEASQPKVLEAFGGKPAAEIRTQYDFGGGGVATLTSPAFKFAGLSKAQGIPVTLSGDGLEMTVTFARRMAQYSMQGSAPRFELTGANGMRLAATDLRFEGQQQRLFPDEPLLYVGSQRFSLAGLEIDPGQDDGPMKGEKIALKDIQYDIQTPASGEFVDLTARIGAAGLLIGAQDYGPAAYDFSLKHAHARTLAALNRDFMELSAKPELLQEGQWLRAFAPIMDKSGALLRDGLVVSIDRIAFRMPEGEAKLNASIQLVDTRAEDFASPWMLIGKIDATAELALPTSLITMLAGSHSGNAQKRKQNAEQTIAGLVEQGFATIDNGIFKSRITFKEGQLQVNDKPFNPLAMALQPSRE
ncbi:hypothetical protein AGMMS50256_22740 [Betaproteobacteria bacterium]|nr:hypothetical protein AGMMS50256_22740 [Betaproteobacteria bacterium]